ncbi:MAG: acetylxylan esterase [Opitutaceae bacterium]|nr:acetylxylan esterase [Opitutaceae bacterium]
MKIHLLAFVILGGLASACVGAETPVVPALKFEARTERASATYKTGEDVSFLISLTRDGQPVDGPIRWILTKDGVAPRREGTGSLTAGKFILRGRLDEPGFLQCRVTFQDHPEEDKSPGLVALAGTAIDPLLIKPSLPVPDDFTAFWAAQKQKLALVPVNARVTPVPTKEKGVEAFDVQADSIGAPVSAYFAKPSNAQPKSLPAYLFVHGAGVISSTLSHAVNWSTKGALAMNLNAHGVPNGQPVAFYTDLLNGELKDYRYRGRDDRETCYFLGMFLRLVRAIDFLTAQPEWNGRDVIVYGHSQGGYQAFAAAGIDERVTFFAAGVPAGCDHTGSTVGRINGWPKLVPNLPDGTPDPRVQQTARYFDCVNFAAHTHAKAAIVSVGFIDWVCPPTSVYAAYNALPIPKQIFDDIPTAHVVSPAATKIMEAAVLKALQSNFLTHQ